MIPLKEAIADIRAGKVVVVVDDEDRENEGDFICAARCATPEVINFMATHGRGLVCAPLIEQRCEELGLELMVGRNTALHATPFTVSIDLLKNGVTTGISASDRSKTILALIDPDTKPEELGKPGHIFPLKARKEGVLRRAGHTEAAIDLSRLAGFEPAGVLVEILREDGEMARLPELREIANKWDLKLISVQDLIKYRLEKESPHHPRNFGAPAHRLWRLRPDCLHPAQQPGPAPGPGERATYRGPSRCWCGCTAPALRATFSAPAAATAAPSCTAPCSRLSARAAA